jgi:hypothetical protein
MYMPDQKELMERLGFLLGTWELRYRIPKSPMSSAGDGIGRGEMKPALGGRYIFFDYEAETTAGNAIAHGVFAWDSKNKCYRYWWFEDSGAFQAATGKLEADGRLFLDWEDTPLEQTFQAEDPDRILLRMWMLDDGGIETTVLEVDFLREGKPRMDANERES